MALAIIIVVLLAADVILPTPSSLISISAALMFGSVVGGLLIFIGMSICCLFGYYLGRSGHSLVSQGSNKTELLLNTWVKQWGAWSLLISRPIPVMAETSIVMAGLTQYPLKRFLIYTIPANALIAIGYGLLVILRH